MPSCLIKNRHKFVKFILRYICDCVENVFCKYNLVNNIGNLLLAIFWYCFVVYMYVLYIL